MMQYNSKDDKICVPKMDNVDIFYNDLKSKSNEFCIVKNFRKNKKS
jgi:hypothetical protein